MNIGWIGACAAIASANGPAGSLRRSPKNVAGKSLSPGVTRSPWIATTPPSRTACREVEGQIRRLDVELDLHFVGLARFLEGTRLRVDFGRTHHDDPLTRGLREEVRAEVVAAHVRGEEDGAAALLHRLEVFQPTNSQSGITRSSLKRTVSPIVQA